MPHLRAGLSRSRLPLPPIPVPVARAVVDCAVYVDGTRTPGYISYTDALHQVRETGTGFVWLGLHEPDATQMQNVGELFGLHELVIEDAIHAHQRPKLEVYDDVRFLVLRTVKYVEHESIDHASEVVETGEIMIFTGPDFVVTVRHGDHTHLSGVRRRLEKRPELLRLGPMAVLHAIADRVVDSYLAVAEKMDTDVEAIENAVFEPSARRVRIEPVYMLKREVLELRRAVSPLSMPLATLTVPDRPGVPTEIRRYLGDVADHLAMVIEQIAEYDLVLSSLLDAATAKIGIQQNTDMRKISAWVAIGAVPTMIAGIFGMNFEHMPGTGHTWAFVTLLVVLTVICVGLFAVFRHHRWL
ncbi:magnesium transporter [Gordonia pseudamarae]|uniref:Magnesium transporter n=1 Tax=Gordonia pseudamarae TaxID=2831662 RepID=A0ABX6IG16_9ACTN|nr:MULTISPECIES: magnesium and cobalt transport protein CorA [Gordonia]MBD0023310.1 magnesium and cobalt transport protein CorA [Gordonia sp. (in: high G+C Gram-positive bacteria)]QHN25873.1 magnesium transporter [Gordonia pseudamarae]QHN34803.1 magnesium transporter [Gordonia pseudamarae]